MHKSNSMPQLLANGMYRRNSINLSKEYLTEDQRDREPLLNHSGSYPIIVDVEESHESTETKRRIADVIIVFLVLLFAESSRGIVLPTLAPFVSKLGGSSVFLGYAVAAFSVGRFASTIGLGYLSTRFGYRSVLIGSVLFSVVGNVTYCFSEVFGIYLVLASRVLTGIGAGTLSVARAYVAHVTLPAERTSYMSYLGAVQFLGFAITPGIGSMLTYIPVFAIGPLGVDKYTSPGYFLAITNGLVLIGLLTIFRNPPPNEVQNPPVVAINTSATITKPKRTPEMIKIFAVFLALNLLVRLVLGIIETLGTPMYIALWDNHKGKAVESGFVFAAMGFVGIGVLFLISYLSKFVPDFYVLECGLATLILGSGLLIGEHLGLIRFLFGTGLIWCIGFPLAQTIIVSMFSKLIGKAPQGTWMGWIGAMGSLGRILGPIAVGFIYDRYNQSVSMLFAVVMSVVPLACTLLILPKKKIQI